MQQARESVEIQSQRAGKYDAAKRKFPRLQFKAKRCKIDKRRLSRQKTERLRKHLEEAASPLGKKVQKKAALWRSCLEICFTFQDSQEARCQRTSVHRQLWGAAQWHRLLLTAAWQSSQKPAAREKNTPVGNVCTQHKQIQKKKITDIYQCCQVIRKFIQLQYFSLNNQINHTLISHVLKDPQINFTKEFKKKL